MWAFHYFRADTGIAGFASRILPSLTFIAGLDPANPMFYHSGADHIDAKSAHFVDVIHTDGGLYGAVQRTGKVDFYANGGTRPQPGCHLFGTPLTPRSIEHYKFITTKFNVWSS